MMREKFDGRYDVEAIDLTRCYAEFERAAAERRRMQALLMAAGETELPKRWFVLHTDRRRDKAVDNALAEAGIERWMPVREITPPMRKGRSKGPRPTYMKSVFPGYIFIRVAPVDACWAWLSRLAGVRGLVGGYDGKASVSEDKVTKLKVFVDEDPEALEMLTHAFRLGEKVMIEDGPFHRFTAIIEALREERVLVEVLLFGRPTPVELDLAQIAKL